MKKLGIMFNDIVNSQQYISMSRHLNEISMNNRDVDIVVFSNNVQAVPQKNEYAILSGTEALDYDGVLIATDLISAYILDRCFCATKKYFYVWDVNWHIYPRPIDFVRKVYLNPEVELIARSKDHAKIIGKVFKQPTYVIEEFDHEEINNIIYS
jgi:hypothetical protein